MNKNQLITVAVVIVFAVAGLFFTNNRSPEVKTAISITPELYKNGSDIFITPSELKEQLGNKRLIILDGSHPKHYAKAHIPGAISIGFKGLSRSEGKPGTPLWGTILPKEKLTKKLESFGVTKSSLIVAYSDTFKGPGAGGRAVWQLRMAGLKNVKLLYGGLETWKQLGHPVTKEVIAPVPSIGLVLSDYNEDHRATKEFIQDNLGKMIVLDVRSKKEFTGDDTSRGESRGGHIQGAKWMEWTTLLNEDGTPKPAEEIVATMASFGVKPDDNFVVY